MNSDTRVFVDGNNVMGSRPDGWWRGRNAAAPRLIADPRRFVAEIDALVEPLGRVHGLGDGEAEPLQRLLLQGRPS